MSAFDGRQATQVSTGPKKRRYGASSGLAVAVSIVRALGSMAISGFALGLIGVARVLIGLAAWVAGRRAA